MSKEFESVEGVTESPVGQIATGPKGGKRDALLAVLMLYLFICSISLMGHGLKTAAKDPAADAWIKNVFDYASIPVAGLCVGVLVTSIVQSSSFTTSLTVGLVATGDLSIVTAVPIIMGANIGTSVTNLLVSLAHVRRRAEFRRALAGACVHDFFNLLSVALFFPLELAFGILSRPAKVFGNWLGGSGLISPDPHKGNVVKWAVSPFIDSANWLFLDVLGLSKPWAGGLIAVLAIVLLFVALFYLVKGLRGLLLSRLSGVFQRVLFANPATSFLVGIIATAMVQSSSVTTSLTVPLVGAGLLRIRQIYPYTLGANIGTTVTALLAALALAAAAVTELEATHAAAGLAVAGAHLMFNVMGTCVFWPLQAIPISFAKGFATVAARRRSLVFIFLLTVFFAIPITVIVLANLLR